MIPESPRLEALDLISGVKAIAAPTPIGVAQLAHTAITATLPPGDGYECSSIKEHIWGKIAPKYIPPDLIYIGKGTPLTAAVKAETWLMKRLESEDYAAMMMKNWHNHAHIFIIVTRTRGKMPPGITDITMTPVGSAKALAPGQGMVAVRGGLNVYAFRPECGQGPPENVDH